MGNLRGGGKERCVLVEVMWIEGKLWRKTYYFKTPISLLTPKNPIQSVMKVKWQITAANCTAKKMKKRVRVVLVQGVATVVGILKFYKEDGYERESRILRNRWEKSRKILEHYTLSNPFELLFCLSIPKSDLTYSLTSFGGMAQGLTRHSILHSAVVRLLYYQTNIFRSLTFGA